MEVRAVEKYIRISPKKARLVANVIRGTNAKKALSVLAFTNKKAAKIILKSVKSAISNAENNKNLDINKLIIKTISIDGGPSLKRSRAGYRGSPAHILKRTSHITVIVSDEIAAADNKIKTNKTENTIAEESIKEMNDKQKPEKTKSILKRRVKEKK